MHGVYQGTLQAVITSTICSHFNVSHAVRTCNEECLRCESGLYRIQASSEYERCQSLQGRRGHSHPAGHSQVWRPGEECAGRAMQRLLARIADFGLD